MHIYARYSSSFLTATLFSLMHSRDCVSPTYHPPSLSLCMCICLSPGPCRDCGKGRHGIWCAILRKVHAIHSGDRRWTGMLSLSHALSLSLSLSLSRPYASYTLCRRRVLSRERICPYKCVLRMKLCENVYVCVLRCH